MIYKKIILISAIFLAFLPSVHAVDETFNNPTWSDISSTASAFGSISSNTRIRGNTASASQYCIELGGTFTSFSTDNTGNITTVRYNTVFGDWQNSGNDTFSDTIICNMPDPEVGTGSLVNSFLEIDFSELTYNDNFVALPENESISYSSILQDTNRLLYQILYVITTLTFFMCMWIFYTFINDLLGKR